MINIIFKKSSRDNTRKMKDIEKIDKSPILFLVNEKMENIP
jgi:hypothetical protein